MKDNSKYLSFERETKAMSGILEPKYSIYIWCINLGARCRNKYLGKRRQTVYHKQRLQCVFYILLPFGDWLGYGL